MRNATVESLHHNVTEEESAFQEWITDQELTDKETVLWNFHRWMRQETDLNSGSIVDYRKYIAEMLDEHTTLDIDPEDIEDAHQKAACNKFLEFRETASKIDKNANSQDQ